MNIAQFGLGRLGSVLIGMALSGVIFLAGIGVAWTTGLVSASHNDPVIHACVSKFTGQARFIAPGVAPNCTSSERLVEWANSTTIGFSEREIVQETIHVTNDTIVQGFATCPTGKQVVGGGAVVSNASVGPAYWLAASAPAGDIQWLARAYSLTPGDADLLIYAICANAES